MKYIIMLLVLLATGCTTENRIARKLIKARVKAPAIVAVFCADMYPPLEYYKDSIVVLPGIEQEPLLLYVGCDTLKELGDKIVVPCPQAAPDTLLKYVKQRVVNRAKEQLLEQQLQEKNRQAAALQQKNKTLGWLATVLLIYTIARWLLRIWRVKLP